MSVDRRRARHRRRGKADLRATAALVQRMQRIEGIRCPRCGARWENHEAFAMRLTEELRCRRGCKYRRSAPARVRADV